MKLEDKIQQEIFLFFWNNYCLPNKSPREIIYHIPNEGKNNGKLTKIGLYVGASDLVFTWCGNHYYCEVKTLEGTQSPSQKKFEKHIVSCGYTYFIVRSLEDFKLYLLNTIIQNNDQTRDIKIKKENNRTRS